MKVYLLYSDPYDDGAEIFGVFSSEELAKQAVENFSSKSNYELFIWKLEVDELTQHFERAKLPERKYLGSMLSAWSQQWTFSVCGLDSFIENDRKEHVVKINGHMY